jgi:OmcA/MtrC family decaheme c-type cytochrome
MASKLGLWGRLAVLLTFSIFFVACDGSDGAPGAAGPAGGAGPPGPPGPPAPPPSGAIVIGDGSTLTAEEIATLGKLTAVITNVTVTSPPVVDFTVTDKNGDPAVGIASGVVWFTFAKLVPPDTMGVPPVNGGLPYWQSYVNRVEDVANNAAGRGSNVLDLAVQANTDSGFSGGSHVEVAPGQYQYTFGTDVTNVTAPIAVPWEPSLTHRVGLEIRLSNATGAEVPLAPDNPVLDFVPDGGAGSGVTKNILNTDNCENCHYEFAFHGGPRKTVEYCVTCHNPGTVDQDSGNSLDFAHLLHSVHMGEDRAGAVPFTIWGFSDFTHDYSEVTYPQAKTYCETCHSAATAPDGDNWNAGATAKTCGGCHADGLVAANFDAVTGQADYSFNHAVSEVPPIGIVADGQCASCHLGTIPSAGPPIIHSLIRGNDRTRAEAGDNFVFEFISATNTGPGEIPVVTFKVTDPAGNPYDIVNAPEFTDSNAALNLYVQWATADYYGGDENGLVHGGRINDDLSTQSIQGLNFRDTGYPYRMRLGAIKDAITNGGGMENADGSFTVPFYRALPDPFTGDVVFGLGGHPAWQYTDEEGVTAFERAATVSALYFPGAARETALDSAKCNNCHKRFLAHGSNRNGNLEFCLMCHNGDAAVCSSNPDPLDGSCPAGETQEGYAFGYMIHSIHSNSATFEGGAFMDITYPQSVANCDTCHKPGSYNVARTSARAVSTNQGSDIRVWTDDIATTATAAACGVCHSSTAARGHFESQAGQVDDLKCTIVGAGCGAADGSSGSGLPNGQEACAVCHGTGAEFETSKYHNPGVE